MADAGSFNADLGINMQFNIDGAGLAEITKTIKEISKGKDLQRYWKDVESATDNASKAIERYSKNVNSKGLAENLLKQINALKAITKKENLSELFPNIELNLDELVESAKKIAPKINSEFSADSFSQAFKTFDLLKEKALDLREVFNMLANYSDIVDENFGLRKENRQFRDLIGDSDVEEVKSKLLEIKKLRDEASETFKTFLKSSNVVTKTEDGYGSFNYDFDDYRFERYFEAIREGSMTAQQAIAEFKLQYDYLLKDNKNNNSDFGLEQLQAFSNKLDSIFRQVEETSEKINDIISNGVITKSVENLSMDSSLSDSQRSLFGNLLKDEESLKSITALFQKLIEESNKTSKVDLFNDEQLQQVLSIFDKIEGHLSSLRSIISDVGDGGEFSPLLSTIDKINTSIKELSTSVKGIGLNMNIDVGSDDELDRKLQTKVANALQAYQKLFNNIKMSSAGGSFINQEFFDFNLDNYDTAYQKLKAIVNFIKKQRAEAKKQFNGYDALYEDSDKSLWKSAQAYLAQVTKAETEIKKANSGESNPLENLFGNTKDLSEVIEQLNKVVEKLNEISSSATEFKNIFKEGFNVTASVEEIDKLTNRVKELEDELSKIKLNHVNVDKSNISSLFENDDSSLLETEKHINNIIDLLNELMSLSQKGTNGVLFGETGKAFNLSTLLQSKTFLSDMRGMLNVFGDEYENLLIDITNKSLDTFIHTHPETVASFSPDDLKSAFMLSDDNDKITKQLVATSNEISFLDIGKIKQSLDSNGLTEKFITEFERATNVAAESIYGVELQYKIKEILIDVLDKFNINADDVYKTSSYNDFANAVSNNTINSLPSARSSVSSFNQKQNSYDWIETVAKDDIDGITKLISEYEKIKNSISSLLQQYQNGTLSSMDEVDSLSKIRNRIEKQLKSFGYGNKEGALRDFSFEQAKQELEAVQKQAEKTSESLSKIGDGNKSNIPSGNETSNLQAQEKIYLKMASNADLVGKSHAEIKQLLMEEDKNGDTINKDLRDRILLLENGRVISEANAEIYKDAYQTESLLGKTQQEVLSILQKENAEIEAGNRLFRERMIYFKDGVVVQEILGDSMRVNGSYNRSVEADEFLHTHPIGKLNQLFSIEDICGFYDEFLKGLKQFSVLSGNKLSKFNLSGLNFDSYDNFVNQYILLIQSVESQFKNFADKGAVPSDKFETVVNNFQRVISKYITDTFGNLGAEFRTFKVDGMGNISDSMPSPLTNKLRDTIFEVSKFLESVYDKIHQGELSVEEAEKQLDAFTAKKFQKTYSQDNKISSSTPIEDVFQGDKIDQVTTSAKELDNTLEQVNIPTDSFDEVLSKLDLAKSELGEIVKITKQSVSDSEGKFHDSYTLKDKRGSTEIYGLSSNTEKGQLLRSNIVGYDAKEIENKFKVQQKAAEQEAKALNQAWEEANKVNNALNETKNTLSSLPRMTELDIQFSSLGAKLSSLNGELTSGKISVADYKKEVKSLTAEYSKLVTIQQNRDVETYKQNTKAAEQEAKAIERMNNELKSYNNQVPKKPADGQRSDKFEGLVQNYKNAIDEAQKYLDNLGDSPVTEEVKKKWKELTDVIEQAKKEMDAVPNAGRGSDEDSRTKEIDKLTKYLEKNTRISKEAREQLEGYLALLKSGDPSVNVKEIHTAWTKVAVAEREAGREGKSFLDIFKNKIVYNYAAQLAGYFLSFMDIIRYTREGIDTLKEFDDGLTKISYTMDMTKSQLDNLGKSILDTAKDINSSIDNAMQVSQIYANMNTSAEEIKKLSEPTLILSNLTGFDASTVADDIQAVTQQFEIAAEESMHIADVYDQISRNISVDYSKILELILETI